MSKPKIYIDGQEGTTGLRIFERFAGRDDIEILTIDPALRKDADERKRNRKKHSDDVAVHIHSRNIPTVDGRFF